MGAMTSGRRTNQHRRIRTLCTSVLALCGALLLTSCDGKPKQEQPVSLVSWGSQLQADLMEDIIDPAAGRAGVKVRADSWDGDYAGLTTRIDRGINTWDLVHVDGIYVLTPRWRSLFYQDPKRGNGELSGALLQNTELTEPMKSGFAVPILEYGYLIAGRQAKFPGHPINQMTWADFWNVKAYPGDRGMRDFPVGNIEAALASLGTPPTTLYTERDPAKVRQMVSRALARIGEIAPNIVWWKTGEALQQGIESGDTPLSAAWSGRVRSSFAAVCRSGQTVASCDVQISPRSSLVSTDWWIIPSNARNKEAASRILAEAMSQKAVSGAAKFATSQGYAVPLRGAEPTDPIARHFIFAGSSDNKEILARISEKFWGENLDWISKEWAKFRAPQ